MHNDRNHEEAMSSRDALLIVEKIGAWSTGELAHLYISSQLPVSSYGSLNDVASSQIPIPHTGSSITRFR
jgi:hypothetical protein